MDYCWALQRLMVGAAWHVPWFGKSRQATPCEMRDTEPHEWWEMTDQTERVTVDRRVVKARLIGWSIASVLAIGGAVLAVCAIADRLAPAERCTPLTAWA